MLVEVAWPSFSSEILNSPFPALPGSTLASSEDCLFTLRSLKPTLSDDPSSLQPCTYVHGFSHRTCSFFLPVYSPDSALVTIPLSFLAPCFISSLLLFCHHLFSDYCVSSDTGAQISNFKENFPFASFHTIACFHCLCFFFPRKLIKIIVHTCYYF